MGLLRNANTGAIIATRVERAVSFLERSVGLLARPKIRPDEGIWLEACGAIHTIGMREAIDVIFLDEERRVLKLCPSVERFQRAVRCPGARAVVGLGDGALRFADILVGDRLELV
ncbi:MAG: DUF192 domain-containing protein [Candidatus Eremiobacteraeota bacterium]|nr:DUF192 domain-containing protein [Candidatus Eremiobacteraeota bacterium]